MSVEVGLEELEERLADYGQFAFLVTIGDSGPHAVSVRVALSDGVLRAGAGRTTSANIAARPAATLLWAPVGDYSLIVDGAGTIEGEGDAAEVVVDPVRAVLHRVASATSDGPSCITVVDRR